MTDPAPPRENALPRLWLVALLTLTTLAYAWQFNWPDRIKNPNENVRLHMARAMAEHGTYEIGQRSRTPEGYLVDHGPIHDDWGYVNDKALVCNDPTEKPPQCAGRLYAAKAPGLSQLGAPVLVALRAGYALLGLGEPSKGAMVWWLRFMCGVLPTLLAWAWLARHLARRLADPGLALAVVLAAALGSLSLTYAQMFAGHQPSGLCLLLAFGALARAGTHERSPGWVALAGLGAAAAAAIEYPAAPAAFLVLAWGLFRRRKLSDIGWLALGASLPAGLMLHFHAVAFGAPWRLPYAFLENAEFVRDIAPGVFGISLPTVEKLQGSLLSPFTGLYFWAPWTALAWLGLARLRRPAASDAGLGTSRLTWSQALQSEPAVACAICLYFLYFQCSHSLWRGGWVIGPRYITAMVPFAAIAVAYGIATLQGRSATVARVALAASGAVAIAATGLASVVSQGFPFLFYNPLSEVVAPLLAHGWVARNPLMALGVPGPWSALPVFAALAFGAVWLAWLATPAGLPRSRRLALAAAGLALAGVGLFGLWQVGPGRSPATDAEVRFLMRLWTPPEPPGAKPL